MGRSQTRKKAFTGCQHAKPCACIVVDLWHLQIKLKAVNVLLLPDYVTLPPEVNITFKPTNYTVREGDNATIILEVQGNSSKDINVVVTFTPITAESEWKVFLQCNMLCYLMFPVDFFDGLDASIHLLQVMSTTVLKAIWLQFQLM